MSDMSPQARETTADGPGHEVDRVKIKTILVFAAALVGVTATVMAILVGFMGYFKSREKTLETTRPAMFDDATGQFPAPRLQRNDTYDMKKLREEENARLASYGWVDKGSGIARIPIDRALAILADRGLPVVKADPAKGAATAMPKADNPTPISPVPPASKADEPKKK